MNLVITTPLYPPDIGGPATYSYEILRRLSRKGHEVKIATLSASAEGPNVYIIQKGRHKFPALLWTYLASFINILRTTKGCDLVYDQNPSLLGLASLLSARLLRKPIITRYPGNTTWEVAFNLRRTEKYLEAFLISPEGGIQVKLRLRLQKFILSKVNKVIVPSQFLKDVLTNYHQIRADKIRVIYNSIDLSDYETLPVRKSQTPENPVLITVGRLTHTKRVDGIIRAFKEIVKDCPQVKLHIVGDGPEKDKLQKLTQELNIREQVKFRGQLNRPETMALLGEADIFILNSVYEGLPHTAIEAMACRTAVIATNIRGTSEAVIDDETGLLVEVDNDVQLKEKITVLLKDRQLRQRLVNTAYQSVRDNFAWERNIELLEREMEEVTGKR